MLLVIAHAYTENHMSQKPCPSNSRSLSNSESKSDGPHGRKRTAQPLPSVAIYDEESMVPDQCKPGDCPVDAEPSPSNGQVMTTVLRTAENG